MAISYGILICAGVIDPAYTGNITIVIANLGTLPFRVVRGDRVAQIILEKIHFPDLMEDTSLGYDPAFYTGGITHHPGRLTGSHAIMQCQGLTTQPTGVVPHHHGLAQPLPGSVQAVLPTTQGSQTTRPNGNDRGNAGLGSDRNA